MLGSRLFQGEPKEYDDHLLRPHYHLLLKARERKILDLIFVNVPSAELTKDEFRNKNDPNGVDLALLGPGGEQDGIMINVVGPGSETLSCLRNVQRTSVIMDSASIANNIPVKVT